MTLLYLCHNVTNMETVKQRVLSAFRRMLRPIARILLRSGVTWRELAEVCKLTYVEVAGEDYGLQGRPTNASRVSILTGLTRREVKRLRDLLAKDQSLASDKLSNATRLLSGWHQDVEFLDKRGEPLVLPVDGDGPSFSRLLQRYAGDVPATAMLKELKYVGAVEETTDGRLLVLTRYYMPAPVDPQAIDRAGSVIADLASTVDRNLARSENQPSRFEGRASNSRIDPASVAEFRDFVEQHGQEFLELIDLWLSDHEVSDQTNTNDQGVRLGMGVYWIEEDAFGKE